MTLHQSRPRPQGAKGVCRGGTLDPGQPQANQHLAIKAPTAMAIRSVVKKSAVLLVYTQT